MWPAILYVRRCPLLRWLNGHVLRIVDIYGNSCLGSLGTDRQLGSKNCFKDELDRQGTTRLLLLHACFFLLRQTFLWHWRRFFSYFFSIDLSTRSRNCSFSMIGWMKWRLWNRPGDKRILIDLTLLDSRARSIPPRSFFSISCSVSLLLADFRLRLIILILIMISFHISYSLSSWTNWLYVLSIDRKEDEEEEDHKTEEPKV